jgi:putative MFS transporter
MIADCAFGTGASVVVAQLGATIMPYVSGAVFSAWKTPGLLGIVAVMYLIMALATWLLGVETKGKSLEEVSEIWEESSLKEEYQLASDTI